MDSTCFFWARNKFLLLVVLVFGLYLVLAWFVPPVGDMANYRQMGEKILSGNKIYNGTNPYPYPPVWIWWEAISVWIADRCFLPFGFIIKVPLLLSQLGITVLLWRILKKDKQKKILLFLLSPVGIFVTVFQGQFDTVVLFLILLAFYFYDRRRLFWGSLLVGISIAVKSFPVLLVPFIWLWLKGTRREKTICLAIMLLPVLILLAPFVFQDMASVYHQLFTYSGTSDYGWGSIVRAFYWLVEDKPYLDVPGLNTAIGWSKLVFVAGLAGLWLYFRQKQSSFVLTKAVVLVFGWFYLVYGGVASQYLLWTLPFLIIFDWSKALSYTFFATMALVGYYGFFLPNLLVWNLFDYIAPPAAAMDLRLSLLPKTVLVFHLATGLCFWLYLWYEGILWIKRK